MHSGYTLVVAAAAAAAGVVMRRAKTMVMDETDV